MQPIMKSHPSFSSQPLSEDTFMPKELEKLSCCFKLLQEDKIEELKKHFSEHVRKTDGIFKAQKTYKGEVYKYNILEVYKCEPDEDKLMNVIPKIIINKYRRRQIKRGDTGKNSLSQRIVAPISPEEAIALVLKITSVILEAAHKGSSCNGQPYSFNLYCAKGEEPSEINDIKNLHFIPLYKVIFEKSYGEAMWKAIILADCIKMAKNILEFFGLRMPYESILPQTSIVPIFSLERGKKMEEFLEILDCLKDGYEAKSFFCGNIFCASWPTYFFEKEKTKVEFEKILQEDSEEAAALRKSIFYPSRGDFTDPEYLLRLVTHERAYHSRFDDKFYAMAMKIVPWETIEDGEGIKIPFLEAFVRALKELE